jgi:hypothetical protein
LFQPLPCPDSARILRHQGNVAELQDGLTTRLVWRHSAFEVLARFSLDVVANVVVERVQYLTAALHDVMPPARPGGAFLVDILGGDVTLIHLEDQGELPRSPRSSPRIRRSSQSDWQHPPVPPIVRACREKLAC